MGYEPNTTPEMRELVVRREHSAVRAMGRTRDDCYAPAVLRDLTAAEAEIARLTRGRDEARAAGEKRDDRLAHLETYVKDLESIVERALAGERRDG